jgi:hypothetical protein
MSAGSSQIRILAVDDHPVVRQGICMLRQTKDERARTATNSTHAFDVTHTFVFTSFSFSERKLKIPPKGPSCALSSNSAMAGQI